MRHPMEIEAVRLDGVVCNPEPWEARTGLAPDERLQFLTLNARCVEFVAQPGKIQELRNCVQGRLMDYLKKQRGFAGAVILSSLKEPRLILVMSLWTGEKDAGNRWETSAAVLRLISPMIDVCTRVHTYEAALPSFVDGRAPAIAAPIC
jgi:hypothetical protein